MLRHFHVALVIRAPLDENLSVQSTASMSISVEGDAVNALSKVKDIVREGMPKAVITHIEVRPG